MSKNIYTVIIANEIATAVNSIPVAIDEARKLCKMEENAGKEISIQKNGEVCFEAVSVKHSTGKMVMMMKDKFISAQKKHADVVSRREEYDKGLKERAEIRAQKKADQKKAAELRQEVKSNNARVRELYAQIHEVHTSYSKKKHSFLKAFKTLQAKEREEVAALKAELEKLLAENSEHKNSLNATNVDVTTVNEDIENIF
jgi:chromosome segregation ATPase